ncbi:MAG: hypothetical protein MJK18_12835, partial [Bdellovibrionales bacterium]|nr:hypothetical protein [Bdellovibrionales bacterium]
MPNSLAISFIQSFMNFRGILQDDILTTLTCKTSPVYLSAMTSFQQLLDIVKKLRGPEGCPWDKEQTHKSLTPYA